MQSPSMPASKTNTRRLVVALVPLGLFIALVALLVFGLGNDPRKVPSPLGGQASAAIQPARAHRPWPQRQHGRPHGQDLAGQRLGLLVQFLPRRTSGIDGLVRQPDFQIVGLNWKDEAANATQCCA
jgi:cytochrome c biogenesis protein CcmG/thiol:disulfide interchange protein DsbE